MTVDDLRRDLSERPGRRELRLLTRDEVIVEDITDLYQACHW